MPTVFQGSAGASASGAANQMGNVGQGSRGDLSLGVLEDGPSIMDLIGRGEACFPQAQQTRDRAVKQNYSWDMATCVHQ